MSTIRVVVDRIEGKIAVCEELSGGYGKRYELSLSALPKGVREGDVLDYANNKFTPNPKAAHERRLFIRKLMDDVFN